MKKEPLYSDDAQLQALLRTGRTAPALPPRFQENVWRRIGDAEAKPESASWLDELVARLLRPRLAFAAVAALLLAGILTGAHAGVETARHEAQTRYLAAVAPNLLR